jgi:hypothetical protein
MSGPGSGTPEGKSDGGVSGGEGGRMTSGSGTGMGLLGWGVGIVPRFPQKCEGMRICSGASHRADMRQSGHSTHRHWLDQPLARASQSGDMNATRRSRPFKTFQA